MAGRAVFYSFYFKLDVARAARIRAVGDVAGNPQESDHRWAVVRQGGDPAIRAWIDEQMTGTSCVIVLIGSATAGRRWVNYEIGRAWQLGKGLLGIHIHRIADDAGDQTIKGPNPIPAIAVNGLALSNYVKTYDPPHLASEDAYTYIAGHLASWVEEAVAIRAAAPPARELGTPARR